MLCYRDRTYCGSEKHLPDCKRIITAEELKDAEKIGLPIAYAKYCDTLPKEQTNE
jgi:hypothetical protein